MLKRIGSHSDSMVLALVLWLCTLPVPDDEWPRLVGQPHRQRSALYRHTDTAQYSIAFIENLN